MTKSRSPMLEENSVPETGFSCGSSSQIQGENETYRACLSQVAQVDRTLFSIQELN